MKMTWGLRGDCVGMRRMIEADRRHRIGKRTQRDMIPLEAFYSIK